MTTNVKQTENTPESFPGILKTSDNEDVFKQDVLFSLANTRGNALNVYSLTEVLCQYLGLELA